MTKLHSVPRSWNPPRRCQGMRPRRFGKRQQLEISPSTSAWRVRLRSSVPQPVLGIFCRSNRSVLTLEMICFQIFQDPVTSGDIRWPVSVLDVERGFPQSDAENLLGCRPNGAAWRKTTLWVFCRYFAGIMVAGNQRLMLTGICENCFLNILYIYLMIWWIFISLAYALQIRVYVYNYIEF